MNKVKIGICQFALRNETSYEEFENHVREQCQIAINESAEIIIFPELMTFNLLAMAGPNLQSDDLQEALIKYVSNFTLGYESIFTNLSKQSGVIILGGSHWVYDEKLKKGFNTAYIFFPDGRIETQIKNHIYPGERDYGTDTFDGLKTFMTPKARIGIMTCYDVEFPEVAQKLVKDEAKILFSSSATYTERGYYRVNGCSKARAIENQVFVVECHSTGTMTVPVDDPIKAYGRSGIYCPIDDQIKVNNGIIIEADSFQEERVILGEVDLEGLEKSRQISEATILNDRRPKMYKEIYKLPL